MHVAFPQTHVQVYEPFQSECDILFGRVVSFSLKSPIDFYETITLTCVTPKSCQNYGKTLGGTFRLWRFFKFAVVVNKIFRQNLPWNSFLAADTDVTMLATWPITLAKSRRPKRSWNLKSLLTDWMNEHVELAKLFSGRLKEEDLNAERKGR